MKTGIKNLLRVTMPVATLIVFASLAFGHGDEKHDETESKEAIVVDTTAEAVAKMEAEKQLLDSIFAIIQKEFVTLEPVFKKGCFDCHTSRTIYPWYHFIPGVKGMIDDDVQEAKKHLDMSDGFPFKGHGKPADDLVAIREVLENGKMPPFNYRFMHWSAKPSDSEKESLFSWIDRGLASLATAGVHPKSANNTEEGKISSGDYACPMHPEETGTEGDNCSICNMKLELVETSGDSEDHSGHDH